MTGTKVWVSYRLVSLGINNYEIYREIRAIEQDSGGNNLGDEYTLSSALVLRSTDFGLTQTIRADLEAADRGVC